MADFSADAGTVRVARAARVRGPRRRADAEVPRFVTPHVLLYFGAVVAIAATGWLLSSGWDTWSDGLRFGVAAGYFLVYAVLSALLLRRGLGIASGLFATMAVAITPLVVYSFEKLIGVWPRSYPGAYQAFHQEVLGSWVAMELVTVAVGLAAVWLVRYPFVLAPVAFVLWYFSMDLAPLAFGRDVTEDERAYVSIGVGVGMIAVGIVLDVLRRRRYAFWWHVFGFLAVTAALCWIEFEHSSARSWGIVTGLSAGVVLASVALQRATWTVFGALGLCSAGCYWSFEAFRHSWGLPFVVTAIGIAFIAVGLAVERVRLPRLRI